MTTAELELKHPGYKFRWWIVAVVLAAEIVDLLDATIVNIAGPTLRASLGSTVTQLQWVIGGYTLALGAGLIVGGRLGDRFGTRFMFLLGIIGFTLASFLCAIAPSIEMLIAFRLIQGFMGAMLLPQGFGLIRGAFPPEEFGKAFAAYGPVFGIAGILGPILGGGIIQGNFFNLDWRVVFLVNIPIGIVAAIISWRVLPKTPINRGIRIDLLGALVIAVASALLVWPLIQGQDAGWPLWTYIMLAGSLATFGIFALTEKATHKRGGTPLIDASIFQKRAYTFGLAGLGIYFAGFTGVYLILTLFLQFGEKFSSADAGLGNIPIALGSAIGGTISGAFLADKIGGRYTLQIGALVQLLGVGLLWLSVQSLSNFSIWQMVPALLVSGIGTGLIAAPIFDTVLTTVEPGQSGSASGVLSAVQSVSSSVGVAIFGTVFFHFATLGQADAGFRNALIVQLILLALFAVVSFALPKRASH